MIKVRGYLIVDPSIQYTAYLVLAPLAALSCIFVAAYARLRFPSGLSVALVWLSVPTVGWLVSNTLELADPTEAGTLFWARVTYIFVVFTPVTWLGFTLRLAEFEGWLRLRRFLWFCILPALTIGMVWTNDLHHWLWRAYHFTPVQGMLAISVDYGPYFWVQVAYSYGLVFVGAALIIRYYLRSTQPFKQQSRLMVVGALMPLLFNFVYIFRLLPWLKKDYTAISFALAVLAFTVAIYRYRLFDLRPVARAALVNSLQDAMLALDLNGRLVDMNPAAETLLGLSDSAIGQADRAVLPDWLASAWRCTDGNEKRQEFAIERRGRMRSLELSTSLLTDQRNRSIGWLVVFSDITAHKQTEQALRGAPANWK
jgi:PAS domain S-box-containing protein